MPDIGSHKFLGPPFEIEDFLDIRAFFHQVEDPGFDHQGNPGLGEIAPQFPEKWTHQYHVADLVQADHQDAPDLGELYSPSRGPSSRPAADGFADGPGDGRRGGPKDEFLD